MKNTPCIKRVDDEPVEVFAEALDIRLTRNNIEILGGGSSPTPWAFACRCPEGELHGGISGRLRRNWVEVSLLWVAEGSRKKGIGRALLEQAEAWARTIKADGLTVSTFEFQAPGFYEACGFREHGRILDIPTGKYRIFFCKDLER